MLEDGPLVRRDDELVPRERPVRHDEAERTDVRPLLGTAADEGQRYAFLTESIRIRCRRFTAFVAPQSSVV